MYVSISILRVFMGETKELLSAELKEPEETQVPSLQMPVLTRSKLTVSISQRILKLQVTQLFTSEWNAK